MNGVQSALLQALARGASSRARVIGFIGVAVIQLAVAFLVRDAVSPGDVSPAITLVDGFGLTLIVPLSALVFGTAVLGDPIEDGTYVYLWLRPIARWRITVAGVIVTAVLVTLLGVVPTVLAAAIALPEADFVLGTAVGALGAAMAYSAIFVLIGQLTRRSLVWGIAYLLIFEQFIARGGRGVGSLSVHSHAASLFGNIADVGLRVAYFSTSTSAIVLVLVTLGATAASARRQETMTVD